MSKYISWSGHNSFQEGDTFSIYRYAEDDQVDPNNILGTPIQVYTEKKFSHIDTTSSPYLNHKYVVVHTRNGKPFSVSNARTARGDRDHGPGPDKLVWGDSNFGYYGVADVAALNNTVDGDDAIYKFQRGAHKFVHNSRIIYASNTAVVVTNGNALKYGACSGGARPGLLETPFFIGEADVFHTDAGGSYRIRFPKLFDRNNSDFNLANYNTQTPYGISEYLDIRRFMLRNIANSAAWGLTATVCEALSGVGTTFTSVTAVSNTGTTAASLTPLANQNSTGLFIIEYCGKNPANFPKV